MKTERISDLFEGGGLIIFRSDEENISDFDYNEIVNLFEKYGVILFRGFDLKPDRLKFFTDLYTQKYINEAMRRKQRFGYKSINDVDVGYDSHFLHSESSYSPIWPEIIWFFCNIPPVKGGSTILCDGLKLWDQFSIKAKEIFLSEPFKFELKIPVKVNIKGKGIQKWVKSLPGTKGYIDWDKGLFHLTVLRYMVNPSRIGNLMCFSNHLLAKEKFKNDPQIINYEMKTVSGKTIPKDIENEIQDRAKSLTYDHIWEKNDLLMIDNKRFMHGRRAFERGIDRDIVIVQTEKASFGYGATTRKPIISNLRHKKIT